jgi:hypothetical protein
MTQFRNSVLKNEKYAIGFLLLIALLSVFSALAFPQDSPKPETIEATARGTEAQMGKEFPVTLTIYGYSPQADQQVLIDAFQNGKDQGLFNALSKMKAAGHISLAGDLGYDVAYIQMILTPNGRKIRFVTNRLLRFGEVSHDSRSLRYNLTYGEFDINDEEKSKSTGTFFPEAELSLDKAGELQYNLMGSPWQLVGIIDWKGTPGVN